MASTYFQEDIYAHHKTITTTGTSVCYLSKEGKNSVAKERELLSPL